MRDVRPQHVGSSFKILHAIYACVLIGAPTNPTPYRSAHRSESHLHTRTLSITIPSNGISRSLGRLTPEYTPRRAPPGLRDRSRQLGTGSSSVLVIPSHTRTTLIPPSPYQHPQPPHQHRTTAPSTSTPKGLPVHPPALTHVTPPRRSNMHAAPKLQTARPLCGSQHCFHTIGFSVHSGRLAISSITTCVTGNPHAW